MNNTEARNYTVEDQPIDSQAAFKTFTQGLMVAEPDIEATAPKLLEKKPGKPPEFLQTLAPVFIGALNEPHLNGHGPLHRVVAQHMAEGAHIDLPDQLATAYADLRDQQPVADPDVITTGHLTDQQLLKGILWTAGLVQEMNQFEESLKPVRRVINE